MISLQEKKTVVSNSTAVNDSIASYDRRDFEGAMMAIYEDAEVSDPTGNYVGKLEILSQLKRWKTAFPDAKSEVTNEITDGDRVATRWSSSTGSAVAKSTGRESPLTLAGLMDQLGVARPRH